MGGNYDYLQCHNGNYDYLRGVLGLLLSSMIRTELGLSNWDGERVRWVGWGIWMGVNLC